MPKQHQQQQKRASPPASQINNGNNFPGWKGPTTLMAFVVFLSLPVAVYIYHPYPLAPTGITQIRSSSRSSATSVHTPRVDPKIVCIVSPHGEPPKILDEATMEIRKQPQHGNSVNYHHERTIQDALDKCERSDPGELTIVVWPGETYQEDLRIPQDLHGLILAAMATGDNRQLASTAIRGKFHDIQPLVASEVGYLKVNDIDFEFTDQPSFIRWITALPLPAVTTFKRGRFLLRP